MGKSFKIRFKRKNILSYNVSGIFFGSFISGAFHVLVPKFEYDAIRDCIRSQKITHTALSSTMLSVLIGFESFLHF